MKNHDLKISKNGGLFAPRHFFVYFVDRPYSGSFEELKDRPSAEWYQIPDISPFKGPTAGSKLMNFD